MSDVHTLRTEGRVPMQYPLWSMLVVLALLAAAPFVSGLLPYGAFLICLYRVIRYDARVFSVDYCVLIPISMLFRTTGGMSLLVYLSLFAGVWYFIRGSVRADGALVLLLALLNYLLARMQMDIGNYLLCFGQLFLLYVLLPCQDDRSAELTVKSFCLSLILSSFYALLLRDTSQIQTLRGTEVPAFLGSTMKRFQGLFADPNYYMSLLIIALALLIKLKDCGRIRSLPMWSMVACLTVFGILTYSKTFFIVFALLVVIFILWQFRNKRFLRGGVLVVVVIIAAAVLLIWENSPIAVVLIRLTNASDLSELTTGRTDLFVTYYEAVTDNIWTTLFGMGLAAENLGRDPHNLFLEITYYTGIVGLGLILCYYGTIVYMMKEKTRRSVRQHLIARYVVLFMVVVLYCTLSGVFSMVSYAAFYLAFLSMILTKIEEEPV